MHFLCHGRARHKPRCAWMEARMRFQARTRTHRAASGARRSSLQIAPVREQVRAVPESVSICCCSGSTCCCSGSICCCLPQLLFADAAAAVAAAAVVIAVVLCDRLRLLSSCEFVRYCECMRSRLTGVNGSEPRCVRLRYAQCCILATVYPRLPRAQCERFRGSVVSSGLHSLMVSRPVPKRACLTRTSAH